MELELEREVPIDDGRLLHVELSGVQQRRVDLRVKVHHLAAYGVHLLLGLELGMVDAARNQKSDMCKKGSE